MEQSRIISLGTFSPTPSSSTRIDDKGQPVRRFAKAILRTGPVYNGGKKWEITSELLASVVSTFQKMRKNDRKVPVQSGHNMDADKTRGEVVDLWIDGNELFASVDLIGEDGISLASRVGVSVYIHPRYEADNTVYENALVHLACVPDPAISGLGEFQPLAASLTGLSFSYSNPEAQNMDAWKTIAALLGITLADSEDEAAIVAKVKTAIEDLKKPKGDKPMAMSVDQGVLSDAAAIVTDRASLLVERGQMSPAQLDAFKKLLGESGKHQPLVLSASAAKDAGLPCTLAASVLDILAMSKATGTGKSKTGAQDDGTPTHVQEADDMVARAIQGYAGAKK